LTAAPVSILKEVSMSSDKKCPHVGGPLTIGGFAGFGFGVFWYAWGKVGFWWAIVYGFFWVPWLGYRVAELLKLGH
jgi:hypothetical protein